MLGQHDGNFLLNNNDAKSAYECLVDFLTMGWNGLRAVVLMPVGLVDASADSDLHIDADFERWLHNDPMVTGNPASRYGDDAPGYLTGNGLGSLEIGAADD